MRIHFIFSILVLCSVELRSTLKSLKEQAAQVYVASRSLSAIQEDLKQHKLNAELQEALVPHIINKYNHQFYSKFSKVLTGHHSRVCSVAIHTSNAQALTGSEDKTARLWNIKTQKTIKILDCHPDAVTAVALSPNGTQALTGTARGILYFWNLEVCDRRLKFTLSDTGDTIVSVLFSPDGTKALARLLHGEAYFLTLKERQEALGFSIKAPAGTKVCSLAFNSDSTKIIFGWTNGGFCIIDSTSKKTDFTLTNYPSDLPIVSLTSHRDKCIIAFSDGKIKVYTLYEALDEKDPMELARYDASFAYPFECSINTTDYKALSDNFTTHPMLCSTPPQIIQLNQDGTKALIVMASNTIRIWDLETGKVIQEIEPTWSSDISSIILSPDGTYVLVGLANGIVQYWHMTYCTITLQELLTLLTPLTQSKLQSFCTIA